MYRQEISISLSTTLYLMIIIISILTRSKCIPVSVYLTVCRMPNNSQGPVPNGHMHTHTHTNVKTAILRGSLG